MSIFSKFKNKHEGKTCFLIGTGPSFNKFDQSKVLNKNNFFIGVNEVPVSGITLDYWFMQDPGKKWNGDPSKRGFYAHEKFLTEYKPRLGKFIGRLYQTEELHKMPENIKYAEYYDLTSTSKEIPFEMNLDKADIKTSASVTFSALQFALFCGFSKIILVGQDCDYSNGIFVSSKATTQFARDHVEPSLLKYWDYFLKISKELELEVYSLNPIRLRPDKYFKEIKISEL